MLRQSGACASSHPTSIVPDAVETDALEAVDPPTEPGPLARALASLRVHATLADGMRVVGTLLVVAGLSSFLLAGVEVRNDLHRFALLLGQTATFTGVAFALARWLDDVSGARLLFGVAALSVPAAFTVLGAMLYSMIAWDASSGSAATFWDRPATAARDMPAFAHWQLGSANELLIAVATAVVTLVPTVFFALAVLARRSAIRLGIATLVASLFLLVPVREPAWTGALVLASAAVAAVAQCALVERDTALRTVGGRFARMLPFVPAVVIAARTVLVDDIDHGFLLFGALALLGLVRTALVATGPVSRLHWVLLPFGALCAAAAVTHLLIMDLWPGLPDAGLMLPFAGVFVVMLDFGRLTRAVRTVSVIETLWATGLLLVATLLANCTTHVAGAALTLAVPAVSVVGLALRRGRVWLGALGALAFAWSLTWFAGPVFDWVAANAWQSMATLGLATIVGAALVQRCGPVMAGRILRVRRRHGAKPSPLEA